MSKEQWDNTLRYLQFTGFAMLVAALPLNNFFMSLASFWLAGVWLFQVITDFQRKNSLRERFSRFLRDRNALLLTSLFLLPLIGLLWTDDFKYASWDLRMKLPILFMPFLLTTLNKISQREYRAILGIFLLSLTFAVIYCLMIYWQMIPRPYKDVREISVFISHVRFSLLLILGLCIAYYESWNRPYGKVLAIMLSILFIGFLYVIGSMTGFIVLAAIIAWMLIRFILSSNNMQWRLCGVALLIVFPVLIFFYLQCCYTQYFTLKENDWANLEERTARGEIYEHNPQYRVVEDGHYVMTYIAWGELYEGWNERSTISPDSADGRGQLLKGTLIRYLASKNLRKDIDGVRALSDDDVRSIELGETSAHEHDKNGLRKRIDRIFFEWSNYMAGGSANGHSVLQRVEFWKTALMIIDEHNWTGVGTGDVKKSFAEMYVRSESPLEQQYRLRAHNQYLTIWLTYGIIGLAWFLVIIILPVFSYCRNVLFISFIIISSLSFLTEDTLESQAGVMFFSFFYLFFTLQKQEEPEALRPLK